MRHETKHILQDNANELSCSPEVLCARVAKKSGVDGRIVVRSLARGLRVVQRGEKLKLQDDEFITTVPRAMEVFTEKELKRTGKHFKRSELSD